MTILNKAQAAKICLGHGLEVLRPGCTEHTSFHKDLFKDKLTVTEKELYIWLGY